MATQNPAPDLRIVIAVLILIAIAATVYYFQVYLPTRPAPSPSPAALAVCNETDIANVTCFESILSWRVCLNGSFSSRAFDCTELSESNLTGACMQEQCVQLDAQKRVTRTYGPAPTGERKVVPITPTATPTPSGAALSLAIDPFSTDYCGNGACGVNEDCSSCARDCACGPDQYCHPVRFLCLPREFCGDGICTIKEQNTGSCCSDCGCTLGKFCAPNVEICATPINVSNSTMTGIVNSFISNQTAFGSNYTLVGIHDDWRNGEVVKVAVLDCNKPGDIYTCRALLTIFANGSTVSAIAN